MSKVKVVVDVNGQPKAQIYLQGTEDENMIKDLACAAAGVKRGNTKKIIIVPNRIINIVI